MADTFDASAHFEKRANIRGALGLHSYIELSRAMLAVMDFRKDSRGPHYRLDYPTANADYHGFITIGRSSTGYKLTMHKTNI